MQTAPKSTNVEGMFSEFLRPTETVEPEAPPVVDDPATPGVEGMFSEFIRPPAPTPKPKTEITLPEDHVGWDEALFGGALNPLKIAATSPKVALDTLKGTLTPDGWKAMGALLDEVTSKGGDWNVLKHAGQTAAFLSPFGGWGAGRKGALAQSILSDEAKQTTTVLDKFRNDLVSAIKESNPNYTPSDTPLLDLVLDQYKIKYGFGPDGANAFRKFLRDEPAEFWSDVMGVISILFGGAGWAAKGAGVASKSAKVARIAAIMKKTPGAKWAGNKVRGWTKASTDQVVKKRRALAGHWENSGARVWLHNNKVAMSGYEGIKTAFEYVNWKPLSAPEMNTFQRIGAYADLLDPANLPFHGLAAGATGGHKLMRKVGNRVLRPNADLIDEVTRQEFETDLQVPMEDLPAAPFTKSPSAADKALRLLLEADERGDTRLRDKLETYDRALLKSWDRLLAAIYSPVDNKGRWMEPGVMLGRIDEAYDDFVSQFIARGEAMYDEVEGIDDLMVLDIGPMVDVISGQVKAYYRGDPVQSRGGKFLLPVAKRTKEYAESKQFKDTDAGRQAEDIEIGEVPQADPDSPDIGGASDSSKAARPAQQQSESAGQNIRTAFGADSRNEYGIKYKLADARKLFPSHNLQGQRTDPTKFRPELQRRELDLGTIETKMAPDIHPNWVLDHYDVIYDGVPFVTSRDEVVVGNHRFLGLMLAYEQRNTNPSWDRYMKYMEDNTFEEFGIDRKVRDDILADGGIPVLVREYDGDVVDDVQFAIDGNITHTSDMTAGERAGSDAHLLNDDVLSTLDVEKKGSLKEVIKSTSDQGKEFKEAFLARFTQGERKGMVNQSDGTFTNQTVERIVNALMNKAYPSDYGRRMWQIFIDDRKRSAGLRNMEAGLRNNVINMIWLKQEVAGGRIDKSLDITDHIAQAVDKMREIKEDIADKRASTLEDYRRQQSLPGMEGMSDTLSDVANRLLDVLNTATGTSGKSKHADSGFGLVY